MRPATTPISSSTTPRNPIGAASDNADPVTSRAKSAAVSVTLNRPVATRVCDPTGMVSAPDRLTPSGSGVIDRARSPSSKLVVGGMATVPESAAVSLMVDGSGPISAVMSTLGRPSMAPAPASVPDSARAHPKVSPSTTPPLSAGNVRSVKANVGSAKLASTSAAEVNVRPSRLDSAGDRLDSFQLAGSAKPAATPQPAWGRRWTCSAISPSGDVAVSHASWNSPASSVSCRVEAGRVTASAAGRVRVFPDRVLTSSASPTAGKLPATVSAPGSVAVTVALAPARARVPVMVAVVLAGAGAGAGAGAVSPVPVVATAAGFVPLAGAVPSGTVAVAPAGVWVMSRVTPDTVRVAGPSGIDQSVAVRSKVIAVPEAVSARLPLIADRPMAGTPGRPRSCPSCCSKVAPVSPKAASTESSRLVSW